MELVLPYVAGFFDGEGSIGIYRGGGVAGRSLRCQVTQQVCPEATDLLTTCQHRWGGSMVIYNKALRRTAYNWQVSGRKAMGFLCDVRPWLVLKAAQADLAINWQRTKPAPRRGPDGRMMPQLPEVTEWHNAVGRALTALKRGEPVEMVLVTGPAFPGTGCAGERRTADEQLS